MAVGRTHRGVLIPVLAVLLGASSVVAGIPAIAHAGDPAFTPALKGELQGTIDEARRRRPLPGISAAITLENGARWTGVAGVAAVDGSAPAVTSDTPFVIGSITKTFVAATILQLQEEGVLAIDDRLERWLPAWPRGERITLRHLLQHTSGESDYFQHPDYPRLVFGRPTHRWTTNEILDLVGAPRFPPGTDSDYSNTNFVLLGLVIEAATGKGVAEGIRARFLDPLGLGATWFQGEEAARAVAAHGYLRDDGRWVGYADGTQHRPHTSAATVAWAAGAMISTPSDLAAWARALYGGRVLAPESLAQMLAFDEHDKGLGVKRYLVGGREAWGHGGSLRGFEAALRYVPSLDAAVVVTWNRGRVDPGAFSHELAAITFRHLYPDATPPEVAPPAWRIRPDAAVAPGLVPARLTWEATELESGIGRYEVLQRVDDGAWAAVTLPAPRSTRLELSLALGHRYAFAIRGIDEEGNGGPWTESVTVVPRIVQERNGSVVLDAAWRQRDVSWALGGRLAGTSTPDRRARYRTDALALGLVSSLGPRRGAVELSSPDLPSVVVDLGASSLASRRVVSTLAWDTPDARDVTVRSLGGPLGTRVDVDAFVVLRAAPPSSGGAPLALAVGVP